MTAKSKLIKHSLNSEPESLVQSYRAASTLSIPRTIRDFALAIVISIIGLILTIGLTSIVLLFGSSTDKSEYLVALILLMGGGTTLVGLLSALFNGACLLIAVSVRTISVELKLSREDEDLSNSELAKA